MTKASKPILLPTPAPSLSNDATVTTPLSVVGESVAKNYIERNVIATRLESLQQWLIEQKANWNKK